MVIFSAMKLSNTSPLKEIGNQVKDNINFPFHKPFSCENNNTILSIIVPCLNEENNLIEFKSRIIKVINDLSITYKIYFIDDGSTDRSNMILRDFGSFFKT